MSRKKVADPIAVLSGGVVSEKTHGGRADGAIVRENFLPLPVDRALELRFDVGEVPEELEIPDVVDARVKPVVYVEEGGLETFDAEKLRQVLLEAGAKYVKSPIVHVVRKVVRRDERHDVEIPLEFSLELFAEETRPREAEEKVAFAAALAREADAGEKE